MGGRKNLSLVEDAGDGGVTACDGNRRGGGRDRRRLVQDGDGGMSASRGAYLGGEARRRLQHVLGQRAARQVANRSDDRHRRLDGSADLRRALGGLRQWKGTRRHGDAHGLGGCGDLAHGGRPGLGALRGVLFQQVQDDVGERLGNEVGERRHGVVHVCERDVDLRFAGERASPRRGLVGDDAEGVEVADGGGDLAHSLFGRQVLGGTHHHARGG